MKETKMFYSQEGTVKMRRMKKMRGMKIMRKNKRRSW
jgi:hypothetical protein